MSFTIHHGDCAEVMRSIAAESVDAIVTSPPYAEQRKSTYGGIPEKDYPSWTVAWMSEAWRVLKPNGSVIINIRPHVKNGQISDYVLRTRLALREAGWAELDELIWYKKAAPPTGSPSRPRRSWESLLWFGKHGRAYGNPKANGQPMKPQTAKDPTNILNSFANKQGWAHDYRGGMRFEGIARSRDVVEVSQGRKTTYERENLVHPATFPVSVPEWCGRLICPPGGTILDPFSGTASTGVAAVRNGWDYIGIDAVEEYVEMSRKRLEAEAA